MRLVSYVANNAASEPGVQRNARMKTAIRGAILGLAFLGFAAPPCGAFLNDWELKVVDGGRPVSGVIVTAAMAGDKVVDTKKTDTRGVALMRIEKNRSYDVTVRMPGGESRVFQVAVGPSKQTSMVDVASKQTSTVDVASKQTPAADVASKQTAAAGATRSRIDPYVALYGGVNFPGSFTNVAGIEEGAGLLESDLALKQSGVIGIKLGTFLQQPTIRHGWREWIGGEIDLSYSSPHVKEQTVTTSGSIPDFPAFDPFDLDIAGQRVRIMTAAMHLLVRYPGKNLQPYIGGGPALFWGRISGNDLGTASDTSLGFQVVGGLRAFLPGNVRWFGFLEGRYQSTSFDFGGNSDDAFLSVFLKTDYAPYQAIGGLGLHF
jgi:hypothetical protein